MTYDLPVTEEKIKPHQVTTLHLVCAIAFAFTGSLIAIYNYTIPLWGGALLCIGAALLALTMFRNKWLISHRINPVARGAELLVSAAIAIYSAMQHWKFPAGIFSVLSVALVSAVYYEQKMRGAMYVRISDEGVLLPSGRKLLQWYEIEEVLVRFGNITINCANNTFYQWGISAGDAENTAIEAYCNRQVEDNKGKGPKNDW